ncbi:MAG TPA: elongation factor G [Alphaproteobacteria bacterium]|nr:elongation factor G [Alphaproteobacteria bacterium]
MPTKSPSGPRCVALVGPYLSGKTTLLENMLFACGAITRKGTVKDGNTVGDAAKEARDRHMSVEVSAASLEFMGEPWTVLDCPGSIEFQQETCNALTVADAAVVVCEPEASKALTLAPLFKYLDDNNIPHLLFINKVDTVSDIRIRDVLAALQAHSARPLALRQVPIREGDAITGYVDLVSERAYHYKAGDASELIQIPSEVKERETSARQALLESLADFDDKLLEQLLEEAVPPKEEIYRLLTRNLQDDRIVPVFLGAADKEHGVRRLLKALRHEVPEVATTALRAGVDTAAGPSAQVFKTYHLPHSGKLSLVRVWSGEIADSANIGGGRVGGIVRMMGHQQEKRPKAVAGEVVAFGRMDEVRTGDLLTPAGRTRAPGAFPALAPMYALAIDAERREDEVKLSGALQKLADEDPSLSVEQNPDTRELVLRGQGEIHLLVAIDKLRNKYNLAVKSRRPRVPYKETIRKSIAQHARFKRQSGGHGQFGDVHIEIRPRPRGAGFEFVNKIVGGAIPKQFIPSCEDGVVEYMNQGPLGFHVVDVQVTLTDGQYHTVDSSDQAFKTAARMGMSEGMPKCEPVLLEPIYNVKISVPSDYTANVQRIISGRRGQILGFDAKAGWPGWDEVSANMPQAELHDLVIDLRSQTLGVGNYAAKFDHLQELTGRLADQVIQARQAAAAAQ